MTTCVSASLDGREKIVICSSINVFIVIVLEVQIATVYLNLTIASKY